MNQLPNTLCVSMVMLSLMGAIPAQSDEQQDRPAGEPKASTERVEKLFATMREGKYDDHQFPKLTRADIPALLEIGKSERVLKSFPRADISSQYELTCREGLVALWLVEGVRKGGRFPSLNSLCLPEGPIAGGWTKASEQNQQQALKAYKEWWKQTESLSAEEANAIDPLAAAKLHWY